MTKKVESGKLKVEGGERRETRTENLRIAELKGADWNTHKAHDDGLKGLIESMAANGMISRVVVRVVGTEADGQHSYEIIDGHRRVEAAKELGWKQVPCEVHDGMGDDEARAMTLTANVQRLENDPLLEAGCIRMMADAGKSYEQIAAVLGKDARYVARRARLCDLSDKWREWFGTVDADADTMEMVAAHEKELQDEVFDAMEMDEDGEVDFDMLERAFKRRLRKLDAHTGFDIEDAGCATCPNNTANHGLLFPVEEGDSAGRCEKSECYVRHWNEETDSRIEALRKKKVEVKAVAQKWNIPNCWNTTPRKTKKNTQPYVYTEDGLKYLVWAEKEVAAVSGGARDALTEEEKAEQKRVRNAHAEWVRNRKAAYGKIRDGIDGDETKARLLAKSVVSTEKYLNRVSDEIVGKLTVGYACDCDCQVYLESLTDSDLKEIGCEPLTEEERKSVESMDPVLDDGTDGAAPRTPEGRERDA